MNIQDNYYIIINFFVLIITYHCLCKYILKYNELTSWYLIHSIANIFITYYCIVPILAIFNDPIYHLFNPTEFYITMILIILLHSYHFLFFECTDDDVFHHVTFVGLGSFVVFFFKNGYFLALSNFFICGLPGAIDYFFLFLYQRGYIEKNIRLREAVFINVWFRSIGLNFVAFFAILNFIYSPKRLENIIELVLQIVMTIGNGNLYMKDIIYAAGKRNIYEV